ncbi:AraC family transcriptional regulator [Magnetospirillum sp. 64-120]|uniref:helix-turn-helix transcriptional regulator n=1 Tax=Magnetospirillum sp. 64-120 TaxID=1895778 RepID=UPI0025B8983B|nr:AraC family transcriptional regulator [Magnetospirillum sp. 64-120]
MSDNNCRSSESPTADSCSSLSVDRLAGILSRLRMTAQVFHAGSLTEERDFTDSPHLHVLRIGQVQVKAEGSSHRVTAPAAILLPRAAPHSITPTDGVADLASARIDLGGIANPLAQALPPVQALDLQADSLGRRLNQVLDLLFAEAQQRHCGHQVVMDRLVEAALVLILRQAMEDARGIGLLAGLAHPQLAVALTAMHDRPGADWSLESLAETAGLSRSVFADTFHQVVGQPPGQYLTGWRMALARTALERGESIKRVARDIGYASPAALSRAFSRHFGVNARTLIKSDR